VDPSAADIRAAAERAPTLDAMRDRLVQCTACAELAETRSRVVPGDFPPGARLLLVGEAPGAQEDEVGRPFVGKGGRLLDEILVAAGLRREEVAVANVLKCRPPRNRQPTRAEAQRCTGWLDRQVLLADPHVVMTLGTTAMTWALGTGLRLTDVRGRVHSWRGRRLVPTYQPSAALRFGPRGTPMAALHDDVRLAASLVAT
jgi:DNA polymerase